LSRPSSPTIADVAREAGVSLATASRALAGYGRVAASTVKRVRLAAETIGYRPNELARAMRSGSTNTIGLVIIADFTNAFFDRATKAVVDAARARGYQVLISNTDEDVAVEWAAVATLVDKQVDGLIVVPSLADSAEHLSPARVAGRPVVLLDRYTDDPSLSSVATDDRMGTRAAVVHALELGHEHLGFLISTVGVTGYTSDEPARMISTVRERVEGFRSAALSAGARVHSQSWRYAQDAPGAAEDAVRSMLDGTEPPTVLFTSNNDMLLASMRVLAERGLAIGRDISLVTVDDSDWASAIAPGIAVVSRPVEEVGKAAVDRLIAQLDDPSLAPVRITLATEFIARGSLTAPARAPGD
jgi:LacI family transcriptional regulator